MTEAIVELFKSVTQNDYLTLFLMSIIPIIELRGAIVIMNGMTNINMVAGMFCCIAGSTAVILPLLLIIRPLIRSLKRTKAFSKMARKMEDNLADRASTVRGVNSDSTDVVVSDGKKKRSLSANAKKFLGLFVFVGVPLPMTGAWTGSCIGGFLNLPIWKAALAVFLGNLVAGGILTGIAVLMPQQYADYFLYGFVILAIAIALMLYFGKAKRIEKRQKEAAAKFKDKNEYELDVLTKEALASGEVLVKREYIDENGDKHIVIGRDPNRNKRYLDEGEI